MTRFERRQVLILLLVLTMALGAPQVSHAFTYWVDLAISYNYTYPNGTVGRIAEMGGRHLRANQQESLWYVRIVALDRNKKIVSAGTARINQPPRTWWGTVGDYRMEYYYAEFNIKTPQGTVVKTSPVYRWKR